MRKHAEKQVKMPLTTIRKEMATLSIRRTREKGGWRGPERDKLVGAIL